MMPLYRTSGLLLLCFLLVPLLALAQTGQLAGRIVLTDHKPAIQAHVTLKGTKQSAITDSAGRFSIHKLPERTYTVLVSSVGHHRHEETIAIKAGVTTELIVTLKPSSVDLGEVQVVGKSESSKLSAQPITVSSLDIKNVFERKSSVTDALDQVSGIRVRSTGAAGAPADISVNGLRGNSVRLYIDGIPIEFVAAGLNISQIPINSIKRVDVYKGVMPVDIGTDALGGGINVVTNQAQYNYLRASYRIGSFNTYQGGLVVGAVNQQKSAYINLTSSYDYSDNNFKMRAVDVESGQPITVRRFNDQYKSLYTRLTAGFMNRPWADDLQFGVTYADIYRAYQNGLAIGNVPFGEAHYKANNYTLSLKYEKSFNEKIALSSLTSYGRLDYVFTDTTKNIYSWTGKVIRRSNFGGESNNHAGPLLPHISTDGVVNRTTVAYALGNAGRLTLSNFYAWKKQTGYNPLIQEAEGEIDYLRRPQDLIKNITGLQYETNLLQNKLTAIVAGKLFHVSLQGIERLTNLPISLANTKPGGNVSLKYAISDQLFVRTSYENAMRIPDFVEVFGDNATIVSNLGIQPERSNNLNLGGAFTRYFGTKFLNVELNGFYRAQKNRIILNANSGFFARYENRQEVTVKGAELAVKASPLANLLATVNLTYQDIRIVKVADRTQEFMQGLRLPNEPIFFFNTELRYTFRNLPDGNNLGVFVFYNRINEFAHILTGAQYNQDNYIPAQNVLDVGASYKFLKKHLTASLNVQNVLNNELYDYYRVPRPGRNVNFQLIYELNNR
ncbi:TonB-dependent receptor [Spirosoma oryzicola]|uniref:TonB-dependent receptor n=1 Tax=Spirosoma oryzicola TaxID=2898794 RepID=UPI001E37C216|nr:TonB-dependent receptor [Spirosoma oryzicola]UHG92007.1 carboxypeptidase-like regulatory domain-containing protein [Spirosoma oryzicola]